MVKLENTDLSAEAATVVITFGNWTMLYKVLFVVCTIVCNHF